jgi:hypothetical protein
MVSRTGYRKGARDEAARSHIFLATPDSLKKSLEGDVMRMRLQRMLARVTNLLDALEDMKTYGRRVPGKRFRTGASLRLPTGPRSHQYFERVAKLSFVKEQVTDVLVGSGLLLVPSVERDPEAEDILYERAASRQDFGDRVGALLADTEAWAKGLKKPD